MTRDEMRQAVLRVLELPIPDRDEERGKWRLLVAEQIVDSLGLEQVGWLCGDCMKRVASSRIEDLLHGYFCACPEPTPLYRLRGDR